MTHTEARKHIIAGFRAVFGRDPSISEAECCQAVGWLETRYGTAWKGAGAGSHNWGAVQSSRPPCDPIRSFQYTDSSPRPDGSSVTYSICFRRYETDEEGAADMIKIMLRTPPERAAAALGDLYALSAAMHAAKYYEGFGSTVTARIANHHRALSSAVERIRAEVNPVARRPVTLQRGAAGETVKTLQRRLNDTGCWELPIDGMFGPRTEIAVRRFQLIRGLAPDGVVGPRTWAELRVTC